MTLLEYGDFECPYCGQAEGAIRELLASFEDDVRYVWRHLPLTDVHPYAQTAAEASEAAAAQGGFWEMYDALLRHQGELRAPQLTAYAEGLGLDVERLLEEVRRREHAPRIARTWRAPTKAACRAPPRSSSTGAATTAPTTSRRSRRR